MILEAETNGTDPEIYKSAARGIHPETIEDYTSLDCDTKPAQSLANKFKFFFEPSSGENCGLKNLAKLMEKYFQDNLFGPGGDGFKNFATNLTYVPPSDEKIIFSGFRPEQRYDVNLSTGEAIHPLTGQKFGPNALRNFYSTKFISIDKLFTSGSKDGDYGKHSLYNDKLTNVSEANANLSFNTADVISNDDL